MVCLPRRFNANPSLKTPLGVRPFDELFDDGPENPIAAMLTGLCLLCLCHVAPGCKVSLGTDGRALPSRAEMYGNASPP